MGLSSFPSGSEGVLPVLVINTILSVSLLKSLLRSAVETMAGRSWVTFSGEEEGDESGFSGGRRRRISVTQYRSLRENNECKSEVGEVSWAAGGGGAPAAECCVCLSRFEEEEEVSELSCRHFFHKGCLEKWFGSERSSCPLCRSSH